MNKSTVPSDETALKLRLGATIRQFRHDLKLSQEELAERAGMHRTYIADAERGVRNMSLSSIARLTGAMELPLAKFFARFEKIAAPPTGTRRAGKRTAAPKKTARKAGRR